MLWTLNGEIKNWNKINEIYVHNVHIKKIKLKHCGQDEYFNKLSNANF